MDCPHTHTYYALSFWGGGGGIFNVKGVELLRSKFREIILQQTKLSHQLAL